MTLKEAIETLGALKLVVANETISEALNLSIEALKRIKECRLADHTIREDYLPGETQE